MLKIPPDDHLLGKHHSWAAYVNNNNGKKAKPIVYINAQRPHENRPWPWFIARMWELNQTTNDSQHQFQLGKFHIIFCFSLVSYVAAGVGFGWLVGLSVVMSVIVKYGKNAELLFMKHLQALNRTLRRAHDQFKMHIKIHR